MSRDRCAPARTRRAARGLTLIELIVTITIVGVAVTGVLGPLTSIATRSAQAMVQQQAAAIAAAYLDEVLLKPYLDPDATPIEALRALYDDIGDYAGLVDNGALDQFGNAVAGLDQFQVSVSVGPGTLGGVPAADVRRVDVTVTHPTGVQVLLSGYRTRY